MKNLEIAQIFRSMADILEVQEVEWKPRAYRKAAMSIENLPEDVEEIYNREGLKGLEEIPGVGERLAKKIVEYIKKGRIKEYERLKKTVPKEIDRLMQIQGVGPKKAKILIKKLHIKSLRDLESAVKKHKISRLRSFKEKTEENILKGIELLKSSKGRTLLGLALPVAEEIVSKIKSLNGVKKAVYAGSLRRMDETIGDLDILVVSDNAEKVMDFFTGMPDVKRVLAKGHTKSSIILKSGLQVDLRVVPAKSFGSALQYFTGNKMHNIKLRKIAIRKGLKLSEYGLFSKRTGKQVAGSSEKEIYQKLGIKYIPPEMREDTGEIEAAISGTLPKLVELKDIKGDLHCHTKWSDGNNTVEEMAVAAKSIGLEYIALTDHSQSEKISHGLTEEDVIKKIKEIAEVNRKMKGFRILSGAEVDILKDGSLDYPDRLLKKIDIVVAAVHSSFKMPRSKMTSRILNAMENKHVHIIGHPTGKILKERRGYDIDFDSIAGAAKDTHTALEINCQPTRMDLDSSYIKKAVEKGVKLSIGTDSHSSGDLKFLRLGVASARKGWCRKQDILNCMDCKKLLKSIKK